MCEEEIRASAGNGDIIWMKTVFFGRSCSVEAGTNHFSHDARSNSLCSHFFHVVFKGLLDKDHKHHANQSYNLDLNTRESKSYLRHNVEGLSANGVIQLMKS